MSRKRDRIFYEPKLIKIKDWKSVSCPLSRRSIHFRDSSLLIHFSPTLIGKGLITQKQSFHACYFGSRHNVGRNEAGGRLSRSQRPKALKHYLRIHLPL